MRNLLTAIAMSILATSLSIPAMAGVEKNDPRVKEVVDSPPYGSLMKAIKKGECNHQGICKDAKTAGKANRRLNGVKRTIKSRFGTTLGPEAYKPVLGKWANVKFRFVAQVDPCEPNPCQNGGICSDAGGKVVCDCGGTGFDGDMCQDKKDAKTKWCASLKKRIPIGDECPPCPKGTKLRKGKCVPNGVKPPKDPCNGVDCNNGVCRVTDGKPVCNCKPGWAGLCDEEVVVIVDNVCCPDDCLSVIEAECRTPWAASILIPGWWILLARLILWWFFLRKKEDEESPPAPPSGIGEDDMERIMEMFDGEFPSLFLQLFSRLVSLLIKHPEANKEVTDALEQGMNDLRKSLAAATEEEEDSNESPEE